MVLIRAITRNTVILSVQEKYDLSKYFTIYFHIFFFLKIICKQKKGCYILNYLYTRPKLAHFVTNSLVQLFGKITKYSWFDSLPKENGATCFKFREILQDITKFIQTSTEQCIIGIRLLSELVVEVNQMDEIEMNRSITKHRKISSSFRDTQLLEIFTLSCNLLNQANQNIKALFSSTADSNSVQERELLSNLLQLSLNCLLYDFIGTTSNEDTSDDLSTVQIPTTWRTGVIIICH